MAAFSMLTKPFLGLNPETGAWVLVWRRKTTTTGISNPPVAPYGCRLKNNKERYRHDDEDLASFCTINFGSI